MSFLDVENRRAIIDRRAIADRLLALRPGKKLGGSEKDGSALFPRRSMPVFPGLRRGLDRLVDVFGVALVHGREHVMLVVRHHCFEGLPGSNLFAADHHRSVDACRRSLGAGANSGADRAQPS